MKASLFKKMMAGFDEAVKHRRGQKARVRVSRFSPAVVVLKPKDIRKIRTTLGLSQTDFARYLGTSVACVRTGNKACAGPRAPHSASLPSPRSAPPPSSNSSPDVHHVICGVCIPDGFAGPRAASYSAPSRGFDSMNPSLPL